MKKIFSLGELCVSDFVKETELSKKKYELDICLDENGTAKLSSQPPSSEMWGKYWYRSGTNQTMTRELKEVIDSCLEIYHLKDKNVWLDIACNDGTLLRQLPENFERIGVDPADDSFFAESSKHAKVYQDYFSKDILPKDFKADVITTIAMFYDLVEPEKFIKDVYDCLSDNGLWCVQMSYTPLMVKQMDFMNICHEHACYYSLTDFKKLLEKCGFLVLDCTLNDANGGSFRVFLRKDISNEKMFGTQQKRDIFQFNVESLLQYEMKLGVSTEKYWKSFYKNIKKLKKQTLEFLKKCKKDKKIVYGYGASTKGNTLLQYFGIDKTLISHIVERSPSKFGLKTVGTDIPIISEEQMRENPPDYLFVLPWHFIEEFKTREQEFLKNGGQFIVPCPKFEIIKEDTKEESQ